MFVKLNPFLCGAIKTEACREHKDILNRPYRCFTLSHVQTAVQQSVSLQACAQRANHQNPCQYRCRYKRKTNLMMMCHIFVMISSLSSTNSLTPGLECVALHIRLNTGFIWTPVSSHQWVMHACERTHVHPWMHINLNRHTHTLKQGSLREICDLVKTHWETNGSD